MDKKRTAVCKLLPKEVRSLVRSGIAITSVGQCVEELVLNSIDARATTIYVAVNLDQLNVRVEDDGIGMSKVDLEAVGIRHMTSKCHNLEDLKVLKNYGYRGEALASIIDVSNSIEITSSTLDSSSTYKRRFTKGKPKGGIEKVLSSRKKSSGVTISVENLLSKLPVRQKRAQNQKSIQIEDIKSKLQQICLINPSITLEFRNDSNCTVVLKYPGCGSFCEAFQTLFGKNFNLVEECYLLGNYFFTSFVSKEMHRTKNYQFVYVNKRFIGRGKIHRTLNEGFTKLLSIQNKVETKDKYPVFLVNIKCGLELYDVTLEPKKMQVEFRDFDSVKKGLDGLLMCFQCTFSSLSQISFPDSSQGSGKKKAKKNTKKNETVVAAIRKKYNSKESSGADLDLKDLGHNVTTHDVKRALHSRFAVRESEENAGIRAAGLYIGSPQHNSSKAKSSSSSSSSSSSAPIFSPVVTKKSPTYPKLNTSRKRTMYDLKMVKGKQKKDNILAPMINKKSKIIPSMNRPKVTKTVFNKFPQWDRSSSKSSLSERESLPRKKFKLSHQNEDLQTSQMKINRNVLEEQDEVDNLQWKMDMYFKKAKESEDLDTRQRSKRYSVAAASSVSASQKKYDDVQCDIVTIESSPDSNYKEKKKAEDLLQKQKDQDNILWFINQSNVGAQHFAETKLTNKPINEVVDSLSYLAKGCEAMKNWDRGRDFLHTFQGVSDYSREMGSTYFNFNHK